MSWLDSVQSRLSLPVIASPMFIVSNPRLVAAECKAGIVGSFPALNARPKAAKTAKAAGTSYIDVRSVPTPKLNEHFEKLKESGQKLEDIRVVSLGDEIGLGRPPAKSDEPFREWAKARGLKPADINPAAGDDWAKVAYDATPALRESNPRLFYHATLYAYHFGIQQLKERTDLIRRALPNAETGANFSPHSGQNLPPSTLALHDGHVTLARVVTSRSVVQSVSRTFSWICSIWAAALRV